MKKATGEINGLPVLRFRFISDSTDTEKDGWLIDQMVFRGYDVSGYFEYRIPDVIKVFPNPMSDFLSIEAITDFENVIFKLYGFDGRLKLIIPVDVHQRVNVTNLSHGVYFYTIEKDNVFIKSGKIVKN